MNYYNEFDKYAAQWLRNLIDAGHIPRGEVDERSVSDVRPSELAGYTQCHFFAGIGGWSLALRLAGWSDDRPVWTGSCPCQPFSVAGAGHGVADERHLWPHWFHLIRAVRPPTVFGEQVEAAIAHGWLDLVQDDLEGEGYAFGAVGVPAAGVGAPHIRQRLWWVASRWCNTDTKRNKQSWQEPCRGTSGRMGWEQQLLPWDGGWAQALTRLRVVDDGIPRCVAATDAARNAIVPQVAAEVIRAYMECRPC